jgi:hypothetical protein
MQLSVFAIAIVVAVAVPAMAIMIVAIVALRGAQPDERPEILRALAVLARANHSSFPRLTYRKQVSSSRAGEKANREST